MPSCSKGHENPEGQQYCGQCGEPLPPQHNGQENRSTGSPSPDPSSRSTLRKGIPVLLGLLILLALLGGFVSLVRGLGEKEIKGSMLLFDSDVEEPLLDNCSGTGGYSDFGHGMPVTVRNEDGRTIGTSSARNAPLGALAERLAINKEVPDAQTARRLLRNIEGQGCMVIFEVEVDESEFYEVEVGRRGEITYSHEDLLESDWYVELSLGEPED